LSLKYQNKMLPTKLQKLAIALKYKYLEDSEPQIVATGKGIMADAIINKAKESGIPIHQDTYLANMLKKVKVGQPIPEELFEVVAQIIAMVYRIDSKISKSSL